MKNQEQKFNVGDVVSFSDVVTNKAGIESVINDTGTIVSGRKSKYDGQKMFYSVKTKSGVYGLWTKKNARVV